MAKSNTLLWIGGLGVAGLVIYEWWKNKQTPAGATQGPALPVSTVSNPINIPQSGFIAPPAAVQVQPPALQMLPAGIDPTMYSVVQKWADTDGRPPVLAMAAANVPSEYQGMYDLITNFWDAGVDPGPNQVTFWDNLRSKYDPTHQSW